MAKILIIDDDEVHADMAKQRLERAGHRVKVHVGPFGATVAATDMLLDLVILDVFMPGLGGPDLLDLMRKRNKARVPVMFYSSMDTGLLAKLAEEHRANGFISKSATREQFIEAVSRLLIEKGTR